MNEALSVRSQSLWQLTQNTRLTVVDILHWRGTPTLENNVPAMLLKNSLQRVNHFKALGLSREPVLQESPPNEQNG
ncbi:hypothetical protein RGR602_PC01789 (plasmid) [Rhizobium gallicum bv. gallicum R602sp]|uniref:Uncharacterized protein n=1 Tax=Rhizobium gallicum bv. gallicum R602sp TaxID=1041138 RepID=A0A0B4XGR1_9HYPH|nr:hypothetical protein RGR602_PC01789 [Rhizobium gallicum bv. gallicum R602sp]